MMRLYRKLSFVSATLCLLLAHPLSAHAQYSQQGPKLVGAGAVGSSHRGRSVALSADGNTALVGGDEDNFVGAVWVWTRSGGVWTQQGPKLVGTGGVGSPHQGWSVALSADGNTALVGGENDGALPFGGVGAVWVWTRSGGVWTQQGPKLVGTGAAGSARQGTSVALSADGNTALVGGQDDDFAVSGAGAAWVWTRSGGVWTQQGPKLVGAGAVGGSSGQGSSVALSADGNTALVGAQFDNGTRGAVWVWTRSGGVWTQQGPKLVGAGAVGINNYQGVSVALSADGATALVGGYGDADACGGRGAVWVWTRSGAVWTQQGPKLAGTGAVGCAAQGWSVSLSADGNTALVGGFIDNAEAGAAWVWTRSGGVWTQQGPKLVGTGAVGSAEQGVSVALSADGTTALVGGQYDNKGVGADADGAAWVFTARADGPSLRGDFDGDGKGDILWQHTDGRSGLWLMNGLGLTGAGGLLGPGTGWSLKQVGDFNGDGKKDLVWQHTDGSTALWLMNGLSLVGGSGVLGPGTGWSVAYVGDFNGDGKSDVVLQHIDGSVGVWLMNGLSLTSGSTLLGPGTGWRVVQVGDVNGDGKTDLLWQHADGSMALWLMNGLSLASGGGLLGVGTGWSVAQVGDLNGDGLSDLVLRHADGSVAAWLMNGLTVASGGGLFGPGTGWSAKQVRDFNGDGKSDLVWQHTDGSVAIWLMNGLGLTSGGGLLGAGTGWSVKQVGDFNGDGKADIVWEHTNGSSAMWLMNGLTLTSGGGLIGPGTGWSPAP